MSSFKGLRLLVLHAGALGDFVLLWPLLRALQRQSASVRLVAASSHIRLARRVLGIDGTGNEHRQAGELMHAPATEANRQWWHRALGWSACDAVISFIGDEPILHANVRQYFGAEWVVAAGAPASDSRRRLWDMACVNTLGEASPQIAARAGVVLYAGSGGRDKLWPIRSWYKLCEQLSVGMAVSGHVSLLAGPVERERLEAPELARFEAAGGRFVMDLDQLVDVLGGAAAFVGADTGPTHLAAQLEVPTLALFGPTDPAVWGPVGSRVTVLRSIDGRMASIDVERVRAAVLRLLTPADQCD